jgi:hypothetical protein
MNFEGENGTASCGWVGLGKGEGGWEYNSTQQPTRGKKQSNKQQTKGTAEERKKRDCAKMRVIKSQICFVSGTHGQLSLSLSLFAAAPPELAAATAAAILSKCVNTAKII